MEGIVFCCHRASPYPLGQLMVDFPALKTQWFFVLLLHLHHTMSDLSHRACCICDPLCDDVRVPRRLLLGHACGGLPSDWPGYSWILKIHPCVLHLLSASDSLVIL